MSEGKVDLKGYGKRNRVVVLQSPPPQTAVPLPEGEALDDSDQMPRDPSLDVVHFAMFTMIFCCWPCGLVGLIYGIRAMKQYYHGEYTQSTATKEIARNWTSCSMISGALSIFGAILLMISIIISRYNL